MSITISKQSFDTIDEARAGLCEILLSARREVCIATPDLWRDAFDCPEVLAAAKQFVLRSPRAVIRIQVAHTRAWQTSGHSWLPLMQRVPSRFDLRMFQSDYWERNSFVEHQVFADRSLAWCVKSEIPLVGMWSDQAAAQVKLWQGEFRARVRHTKEPSHLRRLA